MMGRLGIKCSTICLLLLVALAGCAEAGRTDLLSTRQMAVEKKARDSYEHGVAYMGKGHYLLARQQFTEAVSLAMSQNLHDDALAALARVEKIIAERR